MRKIKNIHEATIIAAWPGTGKSYLGDKYSNVLDAETSYFHYDISDFLDRTEFEKEKISKDRPLNKDWPNNYFKYLKDNISKSKVILIPPKPIILNYLYKNNIPFILVLPNPKLKRVYLKRFEKRGNSQYFLNYLDKMWGKGLGWMKKYDVLKIQLEEDQYLEDAFKLLNIKLNMQKKIKVKFPARLEGNTLYPSYSIKNGKLGGGYGFSISMDNYLTLENNKHEKDLIITPDKDTEVLVKHFVKIFKRKFKVNNQGITVKLQLDSSFKNHSGLGFNLNITCALAHCFRNIFLPEMRDKELLEYLYSVNAEVENNKIIFDEIFTGIGHNCAFNGGICFVNKLGKLIYKHSLPNDYKIILIKTNFKRNSLSTKEVAKKCLKETTISQDENVSIIFSIINSLKEGDLSILEKYNLYLQLQYVLGTYIRGYLNYEELISLLVGFDKNKNCIVGITYSKPNIYIITNHVLKVIKNINREDLKYQVFEFCTHGIQEVVEEMRK